MRRRVLLMAASATVLAALSTTGSGAAGAPAVTLGPVVRIETPGESTCPVEGEPDVVVTRAGTWVAYNDDHECVYSYYLGQMRRLTSLQLVPAGGGAPRYVERLLPTRSDETLFGDPALAPDPHGDGVLLATMYSDSADDVTMEVFRVTPSLSVTRLPSSAIHPPGSNVSDKEFLATDTNRRSRWFGRAYLAWDDFFSVRSVFRAFDGRRWLPHVEIGELGKPDVAVAPDGTVAVAYETGLGVAVRLSRDGGRTFGRPSEAIRGGNPGRLDPQCIRATVGPRQRATKAVRAAYDSLGRLHVVAAVGPPGFVPTVGAAVGGSSDVVHAVSANGSTWRTTTLGTASAVRFHPAVAPTPSGGVAVAWLETADDLHTTYDAYLAVAPRGSQAFGRPVRLSVAPATFPSAMEAQLNSGCYGIGDYIGLATSPRGVVAAWPTTDDTTTPHVDSDVLVREAILR